MQSSAQLNLARLNASHRFQEIPSSIYNCERLQFTHIKNVHSVKKNTLFRSQVNVVPLAEWLDVKSRKSQLLIPNASFERDIPKGNEKREREKKGNEQVRTDQAVLNGAKHSIPMLMKKLSDSKAIQF